MCDWGSENWWSNRFRSEWAMKKFVILCDVIFLVRLQGKFAIDHSWEWRGFTEPIRLERLLKRHLLNRGYFLLLICWSFVVCCIRDRRAWRWAQQSGAAAGGEPPREIRKWLASARLHQPEVREYNEWPSDRPNNRPGERPTDSTTDQATERPGDGRIDRPTDRGLIDRATGWPTERPGYRTSDRPTEWVSIDWSIDWATYRPIDRPKRPTVLIYSIFSLCFPYSPRYSDEDSSSIASGTHVRSVQSGYC